MMSVTPDLLIQDKHGKPILVVEVKNRNPAELDFAISYRGALLRDPVFCKASFFFIVFFDKIYIWTETDSPEAAPRYQIPTYDFIHHFFKKIDSRRMDEEDTIATLAYIFSNRQEDFNDLDPSIYNQLQISGFLKLLPHWNSCVWGTHDRRQSRFADLH